MLTFLHWNYFFSDFRQVTQLRQNSGKIITKFGKTKFRYQFYIQYRTIKLLINRNPENYEKDEFTVPATLK